MNTVVTSKEEILRAALSICHEEGIQALSIRAVAQKCQISVGSVYNYFPSKAALVALSVQEIWMSIFKLDAPDEDFPRFTDFIRALYGRIRAGSAAYPNFFAAHSLNFSHSERAQGAEVMQHYFEAIRSRMAQMLRQDAAVCPDIVRDPDAVQNLTGFCLDHMLGCLLLQRPDCAPLLKVLERLLYAA
jgi:AcrR family transcriptional regulator